MNKFIFLQVEWKKEEPVNPSDINSPEAKSMVFMSMPDNEHKDK